MSVRGIYRRVLITALLIKEENKLEATQMSINRGMDKHKILMHESWMNAKGRLERTILYVSFYMKFKQQVKLICGDTYQESDFPWVWPGGWAAGWQVDSSAKGYDGVSRTRKCSISCS